jgi:hypothetical protein
MAVLKFNQRHSWGNDCLYYCGNPVLQNKNPVLLIKLGYSSLLGGFWELCRKSIKFLIQNVGIDFAEIIHTPVLQFT